ncbi:MAG: thioredoxin family protein [Bacteroidales bacterium]|nr:thioredoxin family protein [Bacteroidales bacterium]
MKRLFLIIFLLSSVFVYSQNVRINLTGKGLENKKVKLSLVEDRISFLQTEKSVQTIASGDSVVNFSLVLDGVSELVISIDAYSYSFLAQPGNIYEMKLRDFNFNLADSFNVLMYKVELPIEILSPENELTSKIIRYDYEVQNYLLNNKRKLYPMRDSLAIAGMYELKNQFLQNEDKSSYFYNYVEYEFAALERSLALRNYNKLRNSLFIDKPILYYNVGYMDCFNNVFDHYFSKGNKFVSQSEIEFWLTTHNHVDFLDALGKDSVLRNEKFRELVFIKGLKDIYTDGFFERGDVLKLLETLAKQTKFEEHKKIALNTIEALLSVSHSGKEFADFVLKNVSDQNVTLSQYSDKPLLLNFVKLNDVESKREMEVVHALYDSIKNNCNIITISCDRNLDALYNFVKNTKVGSKYQWQMLHFDGNYDLLEYYKVKAFPMFVLISKDGRILENPMRNPSEGSLLRFF